MSKHVACHVDIITVLSNRENVFRLALVSCVHAQVLMRLFTVCLTMLSIGHMILLQIF